MLIYANKRKHGAMQGDYGYSNSTTTNTNSNAQRTTFWGFIHADYECNDVIGEMGQSLSSFIQKSQYT